MSSFWSPGVSSPANSSFLPVTDNLYDIGSSALQWKSLYLASDATIGGHVIPKVTATKDLGTSTINWNQLFARIINFGGGNATNEVKSYNGTILRHGLGSIWTAQNWYLGGVLSASLSSSGLLYSGTTGLLGYNTGFGVGNSVVQTTSKSTSVTLNKAAGLITMNAANLAANTTVMFVLNNSFVGVKDHILITMDGAIVTAAAYNVWCYIGTAGQVQIFVRNITGGALAESLALKFMVFKGTDT